MKSFSKSFIFSTLLTVPVYFCLSINAVAACNNPAPRALPFVAPTGQSCPGNYSQTGSTCAPSSDSAGYSFVVPQGQSCPGNYSQQGSICIANSGACYAYYSGGASCPGGYASMGKVCISN